MSALLGLVDVSDIFYFFSARGVGKGESEAPGGGGSIFIKNPRGGGFLQGEGSRGGRVSAANWRMGGYTGRRVKQVQCGKLAF